MNNSIFRHLLFISIVCIGSTSASGVTINFETVPGVTSDPDYLDSSSAPASSRLDTQLLSSFGVRFRSEAPNPNYVALLNLGTLHATSGVNGIGSINSANKNQYSIPMLISFFDPNNSSTKAITNFVSIRGDLANGNGTITMQAYDVTGALLGSTSAVDLGGTTLSLSFSGIQSVRLTETISNVAWDDLTFNPLTPLPEPSALILLGLGGLALAVKMLSQRRPAKQKTC